LADAAGPPRSGPAAAAAAAGTLMLAVSGRLQGAGLRQPPAGRWRPDVALSFLFVRYNADMHQLCGSAVSQLFWPFLHIKAKPAGTAAATDALSRVFVLTSGFDVQRWYAVPRLAARSLSDESPTRHYMIVKQRSMPEKSFSSEPVRRGQVRQRPPPRACARTHAQLGRAAVVMTIKTVEEVRGTVSRATPQGRCHCVCARGRVRIGNHLFACWRLRSI
jgi:hypothetical protein